MDSGQFTFRAEAPADTATGHIGKSRRSGGRHQMAACTSCKRKRRKCDGQYPVCGGCMGSKLACTVHDITTDRVIPRNYIQVLEERVAQLEREALEADGTNGAAKETAALSAHSSPVSAHGGRGSLSAASVENLSSPRSEGSSSEPQLVKDEDLEMEIGYVTLGAGAESRFMGDSSAFSIARAITSSIDYYKTKPVAAQGPEGKDASRHEFRLPFARPSVKTGSAYLSSYRIIVQCQYPFLEWDWVERCFDAVMHGSDEPEPMFFIYMIFAIGAQVSSANSPQYSTGAYTEMYYNKAMEYIAPLVEVNTIRTVQAYLIISTFSQKMPDGSSIWQSTGLAIRTAVSLGLHRSPYRNRHEDLPPSVKKVYQLRYRVFWCAYGLERINGIVLGRPFGISDTDIDAPMPAECPETLVACHVFRLRRILSNICTFVYKPVAIMDTPEGVDTTRVQIVLELNEWMSTFPVVAQPISVFETQNWCRISYHNAMLLLLRPVVLEVSKSKSQAGARLLEWFKVFTQSASAICMNYKDLHAKGKLGYTWLAMHCAFVAGLSFLYCLWLDTHVKVLEWKRRGLIYDTISACSSILYVLAERFPTASVFRDTYERISSAVLVKIEGCSETTEKDSIFDLCLTTGVLEEQSIGIDQYLDYENELLPAASQSEPGEQHPQMSNEEKVLFSVENRKGEGAAAFGWANDSSMWEFLDSTGDKFLRSIYYDMEDFVAR